MQEQVTRKVLVLQDSARTLSAKDSTGSARVNDRGQDGESITFLGNGAVVLDVPMYIQAIYVAGRALRIRQMRPRVLDPDKRRVWVALDVSRFGGEADVILEMARAEGCWVQ